MRVLPPDEQQHTDGPQRLLDECYRFEGELVKAFVGQDGVVGAGGDGLILRCGKQIALPRFERVEEILVPDAVASACTRKDDAGTVQRLGGSGQELLNRFRTRLGRTHMQQPLHASAQDS